MTTAYSLEGLMALHEGMMSRRPAPVPLEPAEEIAAALAMLSASVDRLAQAVRSIRI